MEMARQGFLEGRNHPDDIEGMIKLFRNFSDVSYIREAIRIWGEAEPIAMQLIPISEKLRKEITSASPSQEAINNLLRSIGFINQELTALEDGFSYTLGEGSRWLEGVVLRLLFVIAITVEISGLLLAIYVTRNIQRGLTEIIRAAKAFAKGLYSTRAKVFSRDEIGVVANSFNRMSDELEWCIVDLEQEQRKFKLLLECAPDAIIIMDNNGVIKLVNAQTEKLFEYDRNDLLEQPFELLIPERLREPEPASDSFFAMR
jgi:PAS domain-containing protein